MNTVNMTGPNSTVEAFSTNQLLGILWLLCLSCCAIKREEPVLNAAAYKHKVTVLNSTYNLGRFGFSEQYKRSDQPVRVCRFHSDLPTGVEIHLLGRNELNVKTVNERLERLIRRYFHVSSALGVKAQEL